MRVEIKIVETNVTQPFCIGCHIGIRPYALISSIMTHQLHLSKLAHKKIHYTQVTLVMYGNQKQNQSP
jgi:hypothetical protein